MFEKTKYWIITGFFVVPNLFSWFTDKANQFFQLSILFIVYWCFCEIADIKKILQERQNLNIEVRNPTFVIHKTDTDENKDN